MLLQKQGLQHDLVREGSCLRARQTDSNNGKAVLSASDSLSEVKYSRVACFFGWSGQELPLWGSDIGGKSAIKKNLGRGTISAKALR